ncbi:MAG: phytanoyl-CoA dioxygenase family protein [Capsulimonadales bacterium]|nr:phytanoyl-CoA dioxygenase family protein [Capsulimonadales bacterium]
MNRVSPQTPLSAVLEPFERDGYVLMENALTPAQLTELNDAYDRQLTLHPRPPKATRVEVPRILEQDPAFEPLMDLRPVFRVARAIIGADIELATGGELDHKFAKTPAYIGWHGDFQWMVNVPFPRQNYFVRCVYFMTDVEPDMGPFTLLPGTHRADGPCPGWKDETGQPAYREGQIGITGPAGSCLICNTEIWHTNCPNTADRDRRLIMILYKHAWMKQWQEGYETTPEFAARQTDPLRRQLTGGYVWHYDERHFPAASYPLED